MIILTIKTDNPRAELALYEAKKNSALVVLDEITWHAHKQLAETLLSKIEKLLASSELDWSDIGGIVCFEGPGSFTGLRIGLTVANTLANSLEIPVVGSGEESWIESGVVSLFDPNKPKNVALPKYGAPVHTTKQKK